jgi:capsular exopolysaccharide synthesis family protein
MARLPENHGMRMEQEAPHRQVDADNGAAQGLTPMIFGLLRLVLAVRYRKKLVLAVIAASIAVGGFYYATATRKYMSKAVLLVSNTGADNLDPSIAKPELSQRNNMPTFETMIQSMAVLTAAAQTLAPEDRIDVEKLPRDKWGAGLRDGVSVRTLRSTNLLEISYRSKSPRAAANVVRAIIQSYLDLMDRMHRGTAGEIGDMLTQERNRLAGQLAEKQETLLRIRSRFADMGFRSHGETLHPTIQRAVSFNDALIAAQKDRVEQEASLAAIRSAIGNDEDLGQYLLSVADAVGREVLLANLGLDANEANIQADMEQTLLSAQADFRSMQQTLGPKHPEVVATSRKIDEINGYLEAFQYRLDHCVTQLHDAQLGPWLLNLVEQRLDESKKKETILQSRFEVARTEAIDLCEQLAQIELLERDVKRLNSMNDVMLGQIASVGLKQNRKDIRVAVTEEPTALDTPVWPRFNHVAVLAILGGVGIAMGLVTLLDALDDRFRSADEAQSRLGIPVLGVVPQLREARDGRLETLPAWSDNTSESECFRTLRTSLMLGHSDSRQVAITSAEPGDGKSTIVVNLAACFARAGKRTLLIDADMRRPGVTNRLNMQGMHGLSELLREPDDIAVAITSHLRTTDIPQLDVVPAGPRPLDPGELLGGGRFQQLLAWAESVYDQILIDSPPVLIAADAAIIARLVDGAVVVVQPAKNRRRVVTRALANLEYLKIPILGLVVNRLAPKGEHGYYSDAYNDHYDYNDPYQSDDEHGNDESRAQADEGQPRALTDDPGLTDIADEDDARGHIVPRRVA